MLRSDPCWALPTGTQLDYGLRSAGNDGRECCYRFARELARLGFWSWPQCLRARPARSPACTSIWHRQMRIRQSVAAPCVRATGQCGRTGQRGRSRSPGNSQRATQRQRRRSESKIAGIAGIATTAPRPWTPPGRKCIWGRRSGPANPTSDGCLLIPTDQK